MANRQFEKWKSFFFWRVCIWETEIFILQNTLRKRCSPEEAMVIIHWIKKIFNLLFYLETPKSNCSFLCFKMAMNVRQFAHQHVGTFLRAESQNLDIYYLKDEHNYIACKGVCGNQTHSAMFVFWLTANLPISVVLRMSTAPRTRASPRLIKGVDLQ